MASELRKPSVCVLSGFGLNSEHELAHAFSLAGASPKVVHFSDISGGKAKLEDFEAFAIPGGWSFADEISSGRMLANKLGSAFRAQFESFAASGKPVLGICNGFQALVKLGALPNLSHSFKQEYTLQRNASGRFEDRWVYLKPQKGVCKYFEGVDFLHCPVRHGEGRFAAASKKELSSLEENGQVSLKYADDKMDAGAGYPWNPNGSLLNIAGISDTTGKIFALMPHPECAVRKITYPRFSEGISYEKNSLRFFQNIVLAAQEHV